MTAGELTVASCGCTRGGVERPVVGAAAHRAPTRHPRGIHRPIAGATEGRQQKARANKAEEGASIVRRAANRQKEGAGTTDALRKQAKQGAKQAKRRRGAGDGVEDAGADGPPACPPPSDPPLWRYRTSRWRSARRRRGRRRRPSGSPSRRPPPALGHPPGASRLRAVKGGDGDCDRYNGAICFL